MDFRLFRNVVGVGPIVFVIMGFSSVSHAIERDFQDWKLVCPDGGQRCALSTTSFAEDRTWLSTVRMHPSPEADDIPVQILVPPQVHLASGIFVTVPGVGEKPATYLRCTFRACDARLTLRKGDLSAWKRARAAEILYRPSASSPPIRFTVSLMGLTAAIEAVLEIPE